MDFKQQIERKSIQFRNILLNYSESGIKDTGNVGNCSFIKTINKVTYKPKGEGKFRIGKITDDLNGNFIAIRLDLPKDEFSDEFLLLSTGFSSFIPRNQRANYTCLKLHRAAWDQTVFDTIDIKLYKDEITTYNFSSKEFLYFLDLLISRATGDTVI